MFLAYYNYFSIVSVAIVLLVILFTVLGYMHGFMKKFIQIANSICGLVFSIVFCGKFSNLFTYKIFGEKMADKFYGNMLASETYSKFAGSNDTAGFLKEMGIPSFISKMIAESINVDEACVQASNYMANVVCIIISFLVLFFGTTILCFVLKLIVAALRTCKLIKFLDGVLGIVFYDLLFYIFLCVLMVVLSIIMQTSALSGFREFITNDFNLTGNSFRISKYLYGNNILGNILRAFF